MERKQIILSTARKHFSRYGYSKTTMEQIARDCRITKPTLYSYFDSKAELFKAVIDSEQAECYAMIEQAIDGVNTATAKLHAYVDIQIESIKRFINLGELSLKAVLDFHPEVLRVYNIYRRKEEDFIRRWIEEGIKSKEFAPIDAQSAARFYYLQIASLKFDILVFNNFDDGIDIPEEEKTNILKRECNQFVNIFLNGILRRDNSV